MAVIRVLLIEDDASYSRLIERMLKLSPVEFNVTVADTLKAALSALDQGRFNLILADLNLCDVQGLDTLDAVRSAEAVLPIVLLLGVQEADLAEQAILHGAQFCLRKSEIDTRNLLEAMHQAVRTSRRSPPHEREVKIDRLLAELEEGITAIRNALGSLDNEQRDSPQQSAVQTIRSHIGKMQEKIAHHRCVGQ